MLIFDQLKKNDPQLRMLTLAVLGGLFVLLAGLWWVQVVSAREFQEHLETQSFRTVRIPAMRGKILDRNGAVLAENRPSYNISLYLDDLRNEFQDEYAHLRPVRIETNSPPFWKFWRHSRVAETQRVRLSKQQISDLVWQARYAVASNLVRQVSGELQEPLSLDFNRFVRHCQMSLALPFHVADDVSPAIVARFEEQSAGAAGADLEVQSVRFYPLQTTAAHLLGHLERDDSSAEGEEAYFTYRLPDYRGVVGIEYACDSELRGHAGGKSVLVNSQGYRQAENVWEPADPGQNVVLTIDLRIQEAAEQALASAPVTYAPPVRGAAVVMDVNTGDILALASSPVFNPNDYVRGFSAGEYQHMQALTAEKNRATAENYAPGSIFKTIVGLACLEAGMDPKATIYNPGYIYIAGGHRINDLAKPGIYDFHRAIMDSCNTYFITNGIRYAGIENIVKLGERLHLGERIGLHSRQETPGVFPTLKQVHSRWWPGDTANLCIGQGYISVTPLQMTIMAAALANGGKVLYPRFVDRIESADPSADSRPVVQPKGVVRDHLGVSQRNLAILRDAMRAEVQEGTGRAVAIPGFSICGKTGTAEIKNERNRQTGKTTWFLSYAPEENPRYAVVVMVENGSFGGPTCAPAARKIYEAILQVEKNKTQTVAAK